MPSEKSSQGDRETTPFGLRRRLIDNENVSQVSISINFAPKGEKLIADVFVFKLEGSERDNDDEDDDANGGTKDKKKLGGIKTYRKREGVVLLGMVQTQGHVPRELFKRDALKMKPLADGMLVFVDCDQLSDDVRQDNRSCPRAIG